MNFLKAFKDNPFLGIVRGLPQKEATNCALTCKAAGLKFVEVPLNTPNATAALKSLCEEGEKLGLIVGAGTVINKSDLETAIACGARFIVSPGINAEILAETDKRNIPNIPGALTPTEIMSAMALGATAIKLFPVSAVGGEKYIKELRGPFKEIPFLACGGVRVDNAKNYFNAGADFISFGASVFNVAEMQSGNWTKIEERLRAFYSTAANCSSVSTE